MKGSFAIVFLLLAIATANARYFPYKSQKWRDVPSKWKKCQGIQQLGCQKSATSAMSRFWQFFSWKILLLFSSGSPTCSSSQPLSRSFTIHLTQVLKNACRSEAVCSSKGHSSGKDGKTYKKMASFWWQFIAWDYSILFLGYCIILLLNAKLNTRTLQWELKLVLTYCYKRENITSRNRM